MAAASRRDFEISFDSARIDWTATSELLMHAYWGKSRTPDINMRAFQNSLCVAAFIGETQVGFARLITDRAVFAYLADVIVWPGYRGKGIGKALVQALLDAPALQSVTHWSLTTVDAHGLYEPFGFVRSGRYMRLDRE